jgi:hypothetical protein
VFGELPVHSFGPVYDAHSAMPSFSHNPVCSQRLRSTGCRLERVADQRKIGGQDVVRLRSAGKQGLDFLAQFVVACGRIGKIAGLLAARESEHCVQHLPHLAPALGAQ